MCQICEKLNEIPPSQPKMYEDNKNWWKEMGNCNGITAWTEIINSIFG